MEAVSCFWLGRAVEQKINGGAQAGVEGAPSLENMLNSNCLEIMQGERWITRNKLQWRSNP